MNMQVNKRVLVVDDEESVLMVIKEVLTEDGYEVTTAFNAEEALKIYQQTPFPVVVSDIRMGDMDGIELSGKIKELEHNTEVIIMTSHASMESVITALRTGVYDYLIKPFEDLDVITAVINRAMDKINLLEENKSLVEMLKVNNEKLMEANDLLRELVVKDGLTGLFNHRHFQDTLNAELSRSQRYSNECSILFIDLDHFKSYNDAHGHLKGDELLVELANKIRDGMRDSDIAARYGGDEFVVILPQTGKDQAASVAEKIRKLIKDYPFYGEDVLPNGPITVSMGVATFPEDGNGNNAMIQSADDALYQAKLEGKNKVAKSG